MALNEKENEKTNENELNSKSNVKKSDKQPKKTSINKSNPKKNSILSEPNVEAEDENSQKPQEQEEQKQKQPQQKQKKKTAQQNKSNTQITKKTSTKNNRKENKQKEKEENASQVEEQAEGENADSVKSTNANSLDTTSSADFSQTFEPISIGRQIFKIIENTIFIVIALLALAFTVFTIISTDNSTISNGISILGVDVSGLDRTAATDKVSGHLKDSLENDIILKHNEFETNIGPEQLETKFDVDSAVTAAFEVGSGNNIFLNGYKKMMLLVNHVDIEPDLFINEEQLESALSVISTQLPDAVIQSDYYIDGNNLVVTAGRDGVVIDIPSMENEITTELNNLSYINNPLEIATIFQTPDKVDIEKLYTEIRKDAVDARYDSETHIVYPEENGLDFDISLDEAKAKIEEIPQECTIPLKVLHPNVTTNMIGMEAFPDLLSSFSTKYPASNKGRTTNLKLAADKVNGTVLLPGQTFSYNSVVGERTIAAGYKEAAVYQDGQVVQGLGGGICQISTTLYNAALYANLEIVERRNHQFVPSYVGAGRDATVVYGSQDFKFKNNRNYAIKIVCSVESGIARFDIYGLTEENEYEVVISSSITSRNANSFTSATYKTLKQNGEVVATETVSRDTYKSH